MSHAQADNLLGVVAGGGLALVGSAASWLQETTLAGDIGHALAMGAVGALAGYGVRWIIEQGTKRYQQRKATKQSK